MCVCLLQDSEVFKFILIYKQAEVEHLLDRKAFWRLRSLRTPEVEEKIHSACHALNILA